MAIGDLCGEACWEFDGLLFPAGRLAIAVAESAG